MGSLTEVYSHNYQLQEGFLGSAGAAAVGIAAGSAGWKLGQTYAPAVGAEIGRNVGERLGHATGKTVGPLLGALVVGSLAHKLYYTLYNRTGKEPTKRELMLELQRQQLENALAMERNRGSAQINTTLEKINYQLQKQMDALDSIRESFVDWTEEDEYRLQENLVRSGLRIAGKVGGKALDLSGKAAWAVSKPILKAGGKVAVSGLKKIGGSVLGGAKRGIGVVGRAAANDAKAAASWAGNKVSGAVSKAANVAMNPSRGIGDKLANHANPKLAALGKTLSAKGQEDAMNVITKAQPKLNWMQNQGNARVVWTHGNNQASLGEKAKAFGKIVAGTTADMGIQNASLAAGGAGLAAYKSLPAAQAQSRPPAPQQADQVDSDGNTRPGPDYVMTFGKWRKRLNGDTGR